MDIPGYKFIETICKDDEGGNFLATEESSGQQVIVRFLTKKMLPDAKDIEAYVEEGGAVREFSHPNVARVHEVGGKGDNVYVVMEYVPGISLAEKHTQMCLLDKIYVIKQIAETLDDLHSRGCGHFNLKLSNIIISEHDSRAVLIGYELPTNQKLKSISKKISSSSANFMSPEQIQGDTLDIRSDLYSLGAIFHTLLTGIAPYHSSKSRKILDKHLNSDIPQLKTPLTMFQPILDKAMAKSPEERFQSGEELIAAIDKLDDEEIIKADMSPEEDISKNSDQDNVVTLPTALSLRARQDEQKGSKPSEVKSPETKNKSLAAEGPFEKISGKQNDSQIKNQKVEPKTHIKQKPVKRTAAAPVSSRRKTRLGWPGGLFLAAIFFGSGFYIAQQKGYQLPVISSAYSTELTSAWQALSGLIADTLPTLRAWRDKVLGRQETASDSSSAQTSMPETKPAAHDREPAVDKVEKTSENVIKNSVPTKGENPQSSNKPVLQNAPVLNDAANRVLPASSDTDKVIAPGVNNPNPLQNQAEVERLLHFAEVKRSTGNLLEPADNNAVLLYRQVLILDENNQAALTAITDIRSVVIDQITSKMDNNQLLSADALLTRMSIFFQPAPPYGKLIERLNRLKMEANPVQ